MTPEERANKVWQDTAFHEGSGTIAPTCEAIAVAIRAAVAEEREAIVRMVEGAKWNATCDTIENADELVAAIRARTNTDS